MIEELLAVTATLANGKTVNPVNWKPKVCIDCGNVFIPRSSKSERCGSKTTKTGCSYKNRLKLSIESQERNKDYRSTYMTEYAFKNESHLSQYRQDYYQPRKGHVKNQMLIRNYGITLEEYNQKLILQNYTCAICKGFEPSGNSLHVDHDHDTGLVRDLLCSRCNTSLGLMKENKDYLLAAIDYLKKHGK